MGPSAFDVLKYVDQGKVFGRVHAALARGKCLGVSALYVIDFFVFCATDVDCCDIPCVMCRASSFFTERIRLCSQGKTS